MTLNQPLSIYKASAGSGKTFLLTIQYLRLLLLNPSAYRNILAVTFTNKATAEMKNRILEVLLLLATDNPKAQPYATALHQVVPDITDKQLPLQAEALYKAILHDYSRFSVSTIDAFVQKIVRSFAWEIGIDAGFQLQLNNNPVKQYVVEQMFKRLDTDESLRHWVLDMAAERLGNGKKWDFKDEMLVLSEELFKEKFQAFVTATADLSQQNNLSDAFKKMQKSVGQCTQQFEQKRTQIGEAAIALLVSNHLQMDDFAYKKSGFINFFYNAIEGEVKQPGMRVQEVLANPQKMYTKTTPPTKKHQIDSIAQPLLQLLQQLVDHYNKEMANYLTALAIKKQLGILRLMRVFSDELQNYRKANNSLLISDTHLLLKELTKDTPASFIYEKTGNRYQHFLIDEFQDTSRFQWENFKPLLENSLGEGRYNLVVGDVKQAIYRWRNGDWRLLMQQVAKDLSHLGIAQHTLNENYRSCKEVITFNNFLFTTAATVLQNDLNEDLEKAPEADQQLLTTNGFTSVFTDAYADIQQKVPSNAANNGHVSIQFIATGDTTEDLPDYKTTALQALYTNIVSLLKEGFQPADLAILVRTNKEAALVVQFLTTAQAASDHQKFAIMSNDALLLRNNQAIQLLISAFTFLANPDDTLALTEIKYCYHLLNKTSFSPNTLFSKSLNSDALPTAFLTSKEHLKNMPLPATLHRLIQIFDLQNLTLHISFILAFQDAVAQWNKSIAGSLNEFLNWWKIEGNTQSLLGGKASNAVEVITVHKSKGLAFTVVLMPFLDWDIASKGLTAPTLWVSTKKTPFTNIPVVPVKYNKKLAESHFAYDFFEELVLASMDNLNVLYVAFTRAKNRLYGWASIAEKKEEAKDKDEKENLNTIAKLLHKIAISKSTILLENNETFTPNFDTAALQWQFGNATPPPPNSATYAVKTSIPVVYGNWQNKLQLRYQPAKGLAEQNLPRTMGVQLHDALARLRQPDEIEMVLLQMEVEGLFTTLQKQQAHHIISSILQLPILQGWVNGNLARLAERSLLTADQQIKRPDLILLGKQETIVIDFKFTETENNFSQHQAQVKEYVGLLTAAGFISVKGYLLYGLNEKVVEVV